MQSVSSQNDGMLLKSTTNTSAYDYHHLVS